MGDRVICELRLFICIAGISTGLWIGDNLLAANRLETFFGLLITILTCGIVGWLNGSFSKALINPKLIILNFLTDFVSGIVIGYLIIMMAHALFPLTHTIDEKKCARVLWLSGSLAFIVGAFTSAEASVNN